MNNSISWQNFTVSKEDRAKLKSQVPMVIWFTGLSGSGKSTLANALESKLLKMGKHTYLLDGDNIRHGLCKDLSFSKKDRKENIRRVAEVAKLLADAGLIVLCSFISPFREDRKFVEDLVGKDRYKEIYVECSLSVCEERDPKGLYKKARSGEIKNFTGIEAPYEAPQNPFLKINTSNDSIQNSVTSLVNAIKLRPI